MSVRVRVGPSLRRPTTLGALRMTLFNYAFAVANQGSFVVRIEDIDEKRSKPGLLDEMYDTLSWIGIEKFESEQTGGDYGPYRQSHRLHLYADRARELIDAGVAYRCFCSPARLAGLRRRAPGRGYDGTCRRLDRGSVADLAEGGAPHVIRMRVPRDTGRAALIPDRVYGDLRIPLDAVDDQILVKSDGFPTYHFSSVVDDHLMCITHVLRANVWLVSTPKHILLYDWFGWTPPQFAHIPAMSGDLWSSTVQDFRLRGVVPDAVVNAVASLGWHDGRLSEVFTLREMTSVFTLAGLRRTCGAGDLRRLNWLAAQHLRRTSIEQAAMDVVPHLRGAGLPENNAAYRRQALKLCLPHCHTYAEIVERYGFLFAPPATRSADRHTLPFPATVMAELFGSAAPRQFAAENIARYLRSIADAHGVELGRFLEVVRLAVSGVRSTPDTFAVLALLGREECAARTSAWLAVYEEEPAHHGS